MAGQRRRTGTQMGVVKRSQLRPAAEISDAKLLRQAERNARAARRRARTELTRAEQDLLDARAARRQRRNTT